MLLDQPLYSRKPISNMRTLARILQCREDDLVAIARSADNFYRLAKQTTKTDGSPRICYDALPPLKSIQARIQCLILKQVQYPQYLMGGIPDNGAFQRGYIQNAAAHTGAKTLLKEDIANFFPSTSASAVYSIWRNFFCFSPSVAEGLTRLTTLNGSLPQGAKTSSYLANLAFFSSEAEMAYGLSCLGFRYTRYIDDLTISRTTVASKSDVQQAMKLLNAMVHRYGYRLKRRKHDIVRAGKQMEVTGLVVDVGVSVSRLKRSRVRAAVHECELLASTGIATDKLVAMICRVEGRVAQLRALHPHEGDRLLQRLRALK